MRGANKKQVTTAGFRHLQTNQKTTGLSPMHTAPKKPAPKANITEGVLVNDEKELRDLEVKFRTKKKTLYSMGVELLRKEVRISK
jgi:hypothetical protein